MKDVSGIYRRQQQQQIQRTLKGFTIRGKTHFKHK